MSTLPPAGEGHHTSWPVAALPPALPLKATQFTFREALTANLIRHTRERLEGIVLQILDLPRPPGELPENASTKRSFIETFTYPMSLPELAVLARRIINEVDAAPELQALLDVYVAGGGVEGTPKNLIFAANGPKPELVFADAVDNNIAITKNAQYCLVYDRPITGAGLRYQDLIGWWRGLHPEAGETDADVGRHLHTRLLVSMTDSPPERILFDVYARRYGGERGFGIPALVPQVYLHFDPFTRRQRGPEGSPLPRQRMDFLMLFSDRRRVVIEVDGQQHYSANGRASPALYAQMAAADRDLRLTGYEVHRFGAAEFNDEARARPMLNDFFERLERRSS